MKNKTKGSRDINFIILICAIAFLCAVGFSLMFKVDPVLDSKQFDDLGWRLAEGRGYVDEFMKPTMVREPAYPYFLAALYKIFGHNCMVVFIAQAILFASIAVLTFVLAKDIFGVEIAKISSLATALFPTLANYTIYILSEIFFTFCLTAFIVALSKSLKRDSYAGILLSGILAGILALTKAIMLFLPVFLIAVFFIYDLKRNNFLKIFILKSFILLLAFTVCVSPWISRNNKTFGTYSMTIRGGKALYNRAIKLDYDWTRWRQVLAFSVSEFLGNKLYPNVGVRPNEFLLIEDHMAEKKMTELVNSGLSPAETDKVMARESIEKIKLRPLLYLGQSAFESVKLLGFFHLPSLNEQAAIDLFSKIKGGNILLSLTRGVLRISAYAILLLSLLGLWVSRNSWRGWLAASIVMIYIWTVYSLTFSWGRYTVPLIPCYMIFTAAFFRRRMAK